MHPSRIAAALALVLVSGCGSYYKEAPAGATARMRFAADGQTAVMACSSRWGGTILGMVGGFTQPDPLGSIPQSARATGNTLGMIGYLEQAGAAPIERVIQAGADFEFNYSRVKLVPGSGLTVRRCKVGLSFRPQSGAQYEAMYVDDPVGNRCGATVFQLEERGGQVVRTAVPTTQIPICGDI